MMYGQYIAIGLNERSIFIHVSGTTYHFIPLYLSDRNQLMSQI